MGSPAAASAESIKTSRSRRSRRAWELSSSSMTSRGVRSFAVQSTKSTCFWLILFSCAWAPEVPSEPRRDHSSGSGDPALAKHPVERALRGRQKGARLLVRERLAARDRPPALAEPEWRPKRITARLTNAAMKYKMTETVPEINENRLGARPGMGWAGAGAGG